MIKFIAYNHMQKYWTHENFKGFFFFKKKYNFQCGYKLKNLVEYSRHSISKQK